MNVALKKSPKESYVKFKRSVMENASLHYTFAAVSNGAMAHFGGETLMSEEEQKSKKQKFIDGAISGVCILAAILVGRFAGFLGIGAIALGWVAYNFSKEKVGTFLGILIGAFAGLAAYGFAAVALLDMLG